MVEAPSPLDAVLAEKWAVVRLVDRGACGAVYEGRHVELGRLVAIKIIDPQLARNPDAVERFRREARAAGVVQSDHVVQVLDVGEDDRFGLYLVMELLTGEDLERRLWREPRIEVGTAVDIIVQSARGLSKAHAAGVIHRDLKPGNLFLAKRDDGTLLVKVVDFGISKLLRLETPIGADEPDTGRVLTLMGSAIGTPQYMSPEQAQGNPVDARTDVWSLGVVLFEMIAGRPPYPDLDTYEKTVSAIVHDPTPSLADAAPTCPPAICAVVAAALEHELDKRIPDCATLATRLAEAYAEGLPVLELGEQRSATPAAVTRGDKRFFAIALGLGLVTLLAVGAVVGRDGTTRGASSPVTSEPAASSASATSSARPAPMAPAKRFKPKQKPSGKPSASGKGAPSASVSASASASEVPLGAIGITPTY